MLHAMRWIPWSLVLLTAGVLGYLWQQRPSVSSPAQPQPVYLGKSLRQWSRELKSPDLKVRLQAAKALGALGPEARPAAVALVSALKDQDLPVRWAAAKSLVRVGGPSERAVPVLVHCLGVRTTRLEAAQLLMEVGEPAVPALCRALDDPQSSIRVPCTEVLRDLGPKAGQAVPSLTAALRADNAILRREAARALGRIGSAQAASALIDALDDADDRVRLAASESLTQLGVEAVPALAAALADQGRRRRDGIARVLAHIGPAAKSAEPALRPGLADADPQVRQQAARAIVLVGGDWQPALPVLFTAMQDRGFRWDAIDAMVKIGPPAVTTLAKGLQDPDEVVRSDVARGLGKLGAPGQDAVPALAEALKDPDRSVRREAVAALGRIGPAAKNALPAMKLLFKDPDPLNRGEVAIALALFGPEGAPAVAELIVNLADEDENVRQESAKALVAIGRPAVPGLQAALQHENESVRTTAQTLLQQIGER